MGFFVLPLAPQLPMQGLGHLPCCAQAGTTELLHVVPLLLDPSLDPLHETREHAHTVHQQAAIGGMMDGGRHAGGIEPQLASFGDPGLGCQLYHPVIEGMQRFRTQGV